MPMMAVGEGDRPRPPHEPGAAHDGDGAVGARERRMVFAGLMVAMLLPALDLLILATAGRAIADDFGSTGHITWIFISYQLMLVASMPLYGKLGDLYGRKRTFQTAVALFVVATIAAGLSPSFLALVVARAVQGIAGGGIIGQAQAVIGDIVPPSERGRYAWITPTVWTVAGMIGPFVGGFFVDHLSWRWAFFIKIPAGVVAFVLIGIAFKVPARRVHHDLDVLGAACMVGAVGSLAFVVSTGGETFAWTSPVIVGLLVAGVGLAAAFVWVEGRASEPVVPLAFFRNKVLTVASITTFSIGAANFGMAVFLPLYLQVVKGQTATVAGLSLFPTSVAIVITSFVVGRRVVATGYYRWYPLLGCAVFTSGILLLSTLQTDSPVWHAFAYTFVAGAGSGIASPILVLAAQNAVRYEDLGVASSLALFWRTMGQVFGPAIGGTWWVARFDSLLGSRLEPQQYASLDVDELRNETTAIDALAEPLRSEVLDVFRQALLETFTLGAALAAIGIVSALFMRQVPLRTTVRNEPADAG